MLLDKESDVVKCLQDSLGNPVFCDVKIVATDGELSANKFLLSIRSEYFCSMLSDNNNFVESHTGVVKMPYSKSVLEKVVMFLYSGKMNCEDLMLSSQLELLDLLNLTNLPEVFGVVEKFTVSNHERGLFSLDQCSRLGLVTVGEALLTHLGRNFAHFSQDEAVGTLSGDMLARLLEEEREVEGQTIVRFRTLVNWLSSNGEAVMKEDLLKLFNLDSFTVEELATDVMKSELYEKDHIIEKMRKLYEVQRRELEAKEKEICLLAARKEKEVAEMCEKKSAAENKVAGQGERILAAENKVAAQFRDIGKIKRLTDADIRCICGRCICGTVNVWRDCVPSSIQSKYQNV